jgi:tetratricopeptide (TPR) repeat protein
MALADLLSLATLNTLAGGKAFQLGREYFEEGAVSKFSDTAGTICAQVQGTASYRVVLRAGSGELLAECSCPRAADGYFCKHCVAVGLAWLGAREELPTQTAFGKKNKRRDPWRDIESYLRCQESDVLLDLVLDAARRDERLYRSLLLKAERGAGGVDLVSVYRKTIEEATRLKGFVAWDEVGNLLDTLDDIVESLAELLQPATGGLLVELLEYAIERVETMMEQIDDSDGGMGSLVARLGELHLEACRLSRPDPVTLAERLFRLEMTLPFGICSFDPLAYREVLGEQGLDRYREFALAKWRTVHPRSGDDAYELGRMSITRIMERLAELSGDIAELVEVKSRDLSSGFHFLRIAELWHENGKEELALEWAERGLAAFPDRTDNRLRDFLAGMYLRRGRNDEALQLTWIQFEEHPMLENYKKLAQVADQVGQWQAQRERALSVIDATMAARSIVYGAGKRVPLPLNYSLRVAVALWEQELDDAWQYVNLGVCDRSLVTELAGRLEAARLDDALELYRRVVPVLVDQTNNGAYEQAIGLVRKMAHALKAHERGSELETYLLYLRNEFKRKRNFIKLLDRLADA